MGNELMSWIDASGNMTPLNGEGAYLTLWGRMGAHFPSLKMNEQIVPLLDGSRNRGIIVDPRTVRIPILIQGVDNVSLLLAYRLLATAMNPKRGDGILRTTNADGTMRDLTCSLLGGLEGDETLDSGRGPGWYQVGLTLHACDPYYYDTTATQLTFASPTVAFLSSTFLPLQISSSGVLSSFAATNVGDVEAWPVFIISGPGTNPVLTNVTTGKSITLTLTLASTDVLTINTAPGIKTIVKQDGTNQYAALALTSSLWSLTTGTNAVTLAMTSTTSASSIQVLYKNRWLGV